MARRGVLVLLAAWVGATALVGAVTWTAVSRLDSSGGTAVLSSAEVHHRLASLSPIVAAPQGLVPLGVLRTGKDPALRQATPPARSRSWQLTGGAVGAACRGRAIKLLYASPLDGWAYRLERLAASSLAVGFTRGLERADLEARCEHGSPTRVTDADEKSESEDGD